MQVHRPAATETFTSDSTGRAPSCTCRGSSVQAWGEPWTGNIGTEWMVPDFFIEMTRNLERAGFDALETAMIAAFPATSRWRQAVLNPPFESNEAVLFRRM